MELKKNNRVKFNNKMGTVISNTYRHYNKGNWDRYTEVLFDGDQYIKSVLSVALERVE